MHNKHILQPCLPADITVKHSIYLLPGIAAKLFRCKIQFAQGQRLQGLNQITYTAEGLS